MRREELELFESLQCRGRLRIKSVDSADSSGSEIADVMLECTRHAFARSGPPATDGRRITVVRSGGTRRDST
jgi:hypothetical protein